MTQLLPPKKEVALALLERSNVDVYLDPRAKGVVVPPQFRKEPRLILKIGLNMPVPIPDLRLDDESMSCTLSFNRAKFFCVVPWLSVFAMVGDDGRGMVWPDDVPQELAVRVVEDGRPAPTKPTAVEDPSPSSRGKSKRSAAVAEAAPDGAASERGGAGPKSKRPAKKKKDEAPPARPVLVAVPSPKESSPRVEKLDDRRNAKENEERPNTRDNSAASAGGNAAERRDNPAPPPPRALGDNVRRPPPSTRPKRELPPYLRVVK